LSRRARCRDLNLGCTGEANGWIEGIHKLAKAAMSPNPSARRDPGEPVPRRERDLAAPVRWAVVWGSRCARAAWRRAPYDQPSRCKPRHAWHMRSQRPLPSGMIQDSCRERPAHRRYSDWEPLVHSCTPRPRESRGEAGLPGVWQPERPSELNTLGMRSFRAPLLQLR
jgi:hypothetical protein